MLNETDKKAFEVNGFLVISIIILGIGSFLVFPPLGFMSAIIGGILLTGCTIVAPNEAKVVTFFGRYVGTIRTNGFLVTVPLSHKETVSLKFINF